MTEVRELTGPDVALGYAAMRELRGEFPPLANPQAFMAWVSDEAVRGYRLVGAFVPAAQEAVAVAGFRTFNMLYSGPQIYVDDLSTRPEFRGQGHGRSLLAWVEAEARRLGCTQLHLDSAVHRFPAHRLYLRFGFDITAHHFGKKLT